MGSSSVLFASPVDWLLQDSAGLPLFASSATSENVVVINDHLRSAGPSQKLLSKFALQGIKLPVCT